MSVVFLVVTAIVAMRSAVKSEVIRRELVNSFPPQIRDYDMSRYALHTDALASRRMSTTKRKIVSRKLWISSVKSSGLARSDVPSRGLDDLLQDDLRDNFPSR